MEQRSKEQRSKAIGVRATEAEKTAWEAAAAADGRTLSSWIARRCNGQPASAPVFAPPAPPAPVPEPARATARGKRRA